MTDKPRNTTPQLRNRHFLAIDVTLLIASCALSYALRFDGTSWLSEYHRHDALVYVVATLPLRIALFVAFGLYRRVWYHASIAELERVLAACTVGVAASFVIGVVILPTLGLIPSRIPLSVLAMDGLFSSAALAIPRFLARLQGHRRARALSSRGRPVLIIGAGVAGQMLVRELRGNPQLGLYPIGFLDDDASKRRHVLQEIPVIGGLASIGKVLSTHEVSEIIIAMPEVTGSVVRQIVSAAREAGVPARTVPGLADIISGRVGVQPLRQVEIQDLLRRSPVARSDNSALSELAAHRTVLVTGAGGSIGSEICRQVARLNPNRLVLLGHGENSIFEIQQELVHRYPALNTPTVIADIRERKRMSRIMREYSPDVIFHAAAHKHVPLMEGNVSEAVANNVVGTRNVVESARAAGVRNLVLISSDKAVRPTSVMGATKRIAEQIVQLAAAETGREYVAVRFGNVLGSRGSVVPTFLRQIEAGGPVLVTHPAMRRYFMTIPEAVQLVLEAGVLGYSGEVVMLDMGEPVRIVDLAEDLIRLSGLEVGSDIEIKFTGVRPGEKLNEDIFDGSEQVSPTSVDKVLRVPSAPLRNGAAVNIDRLIRASERDACDADLRRCLHACVPEMRSPWPVPATGVALLPISVAENGDGRGNGHRERSPVIARDSDAVARIAAR
ncbi:MAG: polysaccharide biosynthesis protein [Gemmatimonadaceae bacterium]